MRLKLYFVEISHPAQAARLMLDHKRLEYRRVDIRPGFQSIVTRLHRFRGITVPALDIEGRRVQGTLAIARALERIAPDPPLYPQDHELRSAVQDAERWAEAQLQPIPRCIFRWALAENDELAAGFVRDMQHLPLAGLLARLQGPALRDFCRTHGGTETEVRAHLAALPALLDRIDELLAAGVLGGDQRTAADYQIATAIGAMAALDDLRPPLDSRPLGAFARAVWPGFEIQFPPVIPAAWMTPAAGPTGGLSPTP